MFNFFSNPNKAQEELTRAAFSFLMATSSEGEPMPEISDAYASGNYGIVFWFSNSDSGFLVLQCVAGVWAALGVERGMCDFATLYSQFAVPEKEAEDLCRQMAGSAPARGSSKRGGFGNLGLNQS